MKLFITGVTGYIGHQLLLAAINKGYIVHALVRNANSPLLIHHPNVHYFNGDVTNYTSVEKAMEGCGEVMHVAAITQLWHRERSVFYRVNVGGTRNVLEAACFHNVRRLVFTSSCAVLGPSLQHPVSEDDPRITPFENDYEISKHCAEELLKEYSRRGLVAVIVAPPRVYGPGLLTNGNAVCKVIRNTIKRRMAFVPSAKHVVGNYAFIDDVVEGHFLALQKGLGGEKYILGGENLSYNDFFNTILQLSDQKIKLVVIPKSVLKIAGTLSYAFSLLTRRHTHLTPAIVDRLYQNRAVCCNKAIRQLGYHVTPFRAGLQQTVEFLKSNKYV